MENILIFIVNNIDIKEFEYFCAKLHVTYFLFLVLALFEAWVLALVAVPRQFWQIVLVSFVSLAPASLYLFLSVLAVFLFLPPWPPLQQSGVVKHKNI